MPVDVLERLVRLVATCARCGDPATVQATWRLYCDLHRSSTPDSPILSASLFPRHIRHDPRELKQAWAVRAVLSRPARRPTHERQALACQLLALVPTVCTVCGKPATIVVDPCWCWLCDDDACHEAYAGECAERALLSSLDDGALRDKPLVHYEWPLAGDAFRWRARTPIAGRGNGYAPALFPPAPFQPLPHADTIREALVLVGAGF